MKGNRYPGKLRINSTYGFTLIEVMIVLVIIGILATGVVFMFANPSAKVKGQAFNILGDFNMARSEAVSKNEDVLVDFLDDVDGTVNDGDPKCSKNDIAQCTPGSGTFDGYIICLDVDDDIDCNDELAENIIRITIFPEKVQYYDPAALPDRGPSATPGGGDLIGGSGIVLDDDTAIASFTMEPDGTLEDAVSEAINVVIFAPKGSHTVIHGTPYAVTISPSTGRVRISRWVMGGDWFRK